MFVRKIPADPPAARALGRVIRRLTQEQGFAMTTPPVVDSERQPRIDSDTNFGGRVIRILSGLRQHIDDELAYGDRSLNAFGFRVVRL